MLNYWGVCEVGRAYCEFSTHLILLILEDILSKYSKRRDRLCGLVVRVLGYRSGGPGSIPGTTKKK
jgi:hypothetical protein